MKIKQIYYSKSVLTLGVVAVLMTAGVALSDSDWGASFESSGINREVLSSNEISSQNTPSAAAAVAEITAADRLEMANNISNQDPLMQLASRPKEEPEKDQARGPEASPFSDELVVMMSFPVCP
jgi:hypothetical protein